MKEDEIIESRFVSKTIERAQEKVEKNNFETRKHLLEYDDVLNQQRTVIYAYRRDVLEGEHRIFELVRDFIVSMIQEVVLAHCQKHTVSPDQVTAIFEELSTITGLKKEDLIKAGISTQNIEIIQQDLVNFLLSRYELFRTQTKIKIWSNKQKNAYA